MSTNYFNKGDTIEVLRHTDTNNNIPAWFTATIIDSPSPSGTLHVKFNTLFVETYGKTGSRKRKNITEYVNVAVTRPIPAAEPRQCYIVDRKEDDLQKEKSSRGLIFQSKKGTKLKIVCSTQTPKAPIVQNGARVEVRSHEEGYHGARYVATVVGSVGKDNVLVEYDTLTTDDYKQQLVEMVHISDIRPLPPVVRRERSFDLLEEVDAWYHDGWWVGVITKVLTNLKYVVYFWTTSDEQEFQHSNLRSHQELIDEKWVASFSRPKLAENPRLQKVKLQTSGRTSMLNLLCGLKVEIAHGSGRYLSNWYPAVLIGRVRNGKYLVEYRTVKTNNGQQLVEEEVDALCIRPSPPIVQQVHQFEKNDAVDAWDVNGWRIGQIYTVIRDYRYEVYFWATDAKVEFQHAYLRPHQDFIDGAWLGSYNKQ